ncbi:MAG: hypothetical protein Q8Q47_04365, partial [Ignavibacteriaceae bacterium]|nr:hypothetical protein [Ignavibacteriaceae bacterium]
MSKTILLACINFLFIIGCSSTKYLQSSVVSDLGSNIKNVQVYVSYSPGNAMLYLVGESPLYRKTVSTSNNRSVVSSGGVKTENDNYTKESEISISFDTPGVIDNYGVGWVNVDFGDDVILKF